MVIIFPTDTVYGIGTPIFDIDGINKIYDIKHRSKDKPLACLCASLSQIEDIAVLNDDARKLIKDFLPGALTIILESKPEVCDKIGYKTIGVRIPNNDLAISLLNENGPMLTTSVNESGKTPLNDYESIKNAYGNVVDKIYYDDEPSSSIASTVIMIIGNELKVLRSGSITIEMIKNSLKED